MARANIIELEKTVERLVREHLAAYEAEVRGRLQGAFAAGCPRTQTGASQRSASKSTPKKSTVPRRTAEDLAAVGERFYAVLQEHAGETMSVLSQKLGLKPQELGRPVALLKKDERVRTVGERSRMRYYPMTPSPAV